MNTKIVYIILLVTAITGCKTVQQGLFTKQSPHEEYTSMLNNSGLIDYKLGQIWMQAAADGMLNPVNVEIPFSEALVFKNEHKSAASYRLFLHEGQFLHVMAEPEQQDTSHVFIDLFRLKDGEYKQEAFAEKDSVRLDYKIRRNGEYIVRIQPELLAEGLLTVYIFTDSSLNFPVPEKDFNSISSFFGDPREGGLRRHEGVDIFAPRGTPALAVGSGKVARTGTNSMGGKVVWVTDSQRGYNYYYAHLDTQMVRPGMKVNAGDTLGLIGNTGNAVTTPPHLHFGIYAFGRRSIDPYIFFHNTEMQVIDSFQIRQFAGKWARTTAPKTNLRAAPGMNTEISRSLPADVPLIIRSVAGKWLRVELPEGTNGYVYASLLKPVNEPVGKIEVTGKIVRSRPHHQARAQKLILDSEKVNVYAQYNSYLLISCSDNQFGWIHAES